MRVIVKLRLPALFGSRPRVNQSVVPSIGFKPLQSTSFASKPVGTQSIEIETAEPFTFEQVKPAPSVTEPTTTFSATLRDCLDDWEVEQTTAEYKASIQNAYLSSAPAPSVPAPAASPAAVAETTTAVATPAAPTPLNKVWSWAQTRYKMTATKRLRVSETVALGEKRFVAIVSIEGREFLIGGGASGVSLLAQLDPAQGTASQVDLNAMGASL